MRFKCAIGVQSARQKVANLVEAVRTTLLNAAEQTKDAALDTDIHTVDLTSMVKGSVIKDIAIGEILGFCNGDKELEDYVLEIAPSLCLNSNNNLRSNESIQKKIAAIKDSLDEIKSLQKSYPGTAEQIKDSVSLLESSAFPKGTLTKIAEVIETCSFTQVSSLNSRSSASDIFKAMDELRVAIGTFQKEVNIDKIFADIGEEAGGPHRMAARNVAMTLILSKLGPGVTARLPHIVSSAQFDTMRAITTELKGQIHDHAPEVINVNGDGKAYETASVIVNELDLAVDFFIENLNFGSERPVGSNGNVEFDINGEQAVDIRIYLGDVAEQSQV